MVQATASQGIQVDDEPALAQALVGNFSKLAPERAASLFMRAAYLALHSTVLHTIRQDGATATRSSSNPMSPPAPSEGGAGVSPTAVWVPSRAPDFAALTPDLLVGDSPAQEKLQALVDHAEVRRLDVRMQASMAKSIDAIFAGTEWLTAAEVGKAYRPDALNPHSIPSRWRAAGRIFGVERRGHLLFPRYEFDALFEPVATMSTILQVFAKLPALGIASWFESTNSYLDGRRPREMLSHDPALVVQAAEYHVVGPTHG